MINMPDRLSEVREKLAAGEKVDLGLVASLQMLDVVIASRQQMEPDIAASEDAYAAAESIIRPAPH